MANRERAPTTEDRLQRRLERERARRRETEAHAEKSTRELYQQRLNLELVNALAVAANQARGFPESAKQALDLLIHRTPWKAGWVFWCESDGTSLQSMGQVPEGDGTSSAELPPDRGQTGDPPGLNEAIQSGRIQWLEPGSTSEPSGPSQGSPCECVVPIRDRSGYRAALYLLGEPPIAGERTHWEELLEQMGYHLGLVLDRERDWRTIEELAYRDPLTGLPNASLLRDRLEALLEQTGGDPRRLAVLHAELDGYKELTTGWPGTAVDQVIQEIGERLATQLPASKVLARVGEDRFVVVQAGREEHSARLTGERIRNLLQELPTGLGINLDTTASIGISLFPEHGSSADDLVHAAKTASHLAEKAGGNRVRLFDHTEEDELRRRLTLIQEVPRALEQEDFHLLYQPQFDLIRGESWGTEALLRWSHPSRGAIPPGEFIPQLEESHLIEGVGAWVLHTACQQAGRWHRAGSPLARVAVNVAPTQLASAGFLDRVDEALAASGLPPESLTVEITERVLVRSDPRIAATLNELCRRGIRLALDDFGTGYSALAYLQQFPLTELKIDQSFVSGLDPSSQRASLVRTIVQLSDTLGLEALAEGIETEEDRETLVSLGCRLGQGYGLGRPDFPHRLPDRLTRLRGPS